MTESWGLKQQVGQTWLARLEDCLVGNTVKLTAS